MPKPHLAFRNFQKKTIRKTGQFFGSRPWAGSDEDKHEKFAKVLRDLSAAYDIPSPALEVRPLPEDLEGPAPMAYDANRSVIILGRYSALSLLIGFRLHMQAQGCVEGASGVDPDREDAYKWACSLFYTVRPKVFRKAVRQGKILGVDPSDLLRSGSTHVSPDEVRAPDDISTLFAEDETTGGEPLTEDDIGVSEATLAELAAAAADGNPEVILGEWLASLTIAPASVRQHGNVVRSFWEFSNAAPDGPDEAAILAAFLEGHSPSTAQKYRSILRKWQEFLAARATV